MLNNRIFFYDKLIGLLKQLSPSHIRRGYFVVTLTVLATFVEALGISLLIPLLSYIVSPESLELSPFFQPFIKHQNQPHSDSILLFIIFFIALYFIFRSIYLGLVNYLQMSFIYRIKRDLSIKLFSGYLRSSINVVKNSSSSNLIQSLSIELHQVIINALQPIILIFSEILISIALAILLIVTEPIGAIIVISIMALAIVVFQKFTKEFLVDIGRTRQLNEESRLKVINESLGGFIDIKWLNKESFFIDSYDDFNAKATKAEAYQATLTHIPRIWIELVGITGILLLVFFLNSNVEDPAIVVAKLGLFAAVAIRLMPSANRVLNQMQYLRYATAAISRIQSEFGKVQRINNDFGMPPSKDYPFSFEDYIELKNISFSYGSKKIFRDLEIKIKKGDFIGIRGSSGSGKTTLLNLFLMFHKPDSGTFVIDGGDGFSSKYEWLSSIGLVQQDVFLLDESIKRNIAFGLDDREIDLGLVDRTLDEAGLSEMIRSLPDGVDTIVGERGSNLSGGQRQRIGIARALYQQPSILFLDEATSALDVDTERGLLDVLQQYKGQLTIIMIAHRESALKICDCVYELRQGQLNKL